MEDLLRRISQHRPIPAKVNQLKSRLAAAGGASHLRTPSKPCNYSLWIKAQHEENLRLADLIVLHSQKTLIPDKRDITPKLEEISEKHVKEINLLGNQAQTIRLGIERVKTQAQNLRDKKVALQIRRRSAQAQEHDERSSAHLWKTRAEDLARQLAELHATIIKAKPIITQSKDDWGLVRTTQKLQKNLLELLQKNKTLTEQVRDVAKQKRLFDVRLRATLLEIEAVGQAEMRGTPLQESGATLSGDLVSEHTLSFFNQAMNSITLQLPQRRDQRMACIDLLAREFSAYWRDTQTLYTLLEDLQQMARKRNLDEALEFLIESMSRVLECDRASCWICDPLRGVAWTRKAKTGRGGGKESFSIPLGRGLVGVSYLSQSVVNIKDAYIDPRFDRSVDLKTGYRTRAVFCVPVFREGKGVVAVVQAINKSSPHMISFSRRDEFILHVLGYAMTNVLSQCQVQEETLKSAQRRDLLLDTAEELFSGVRNKRDLIVLLKAKMAELWKAAHTSLVLVYSDYFARLDLDREGTVMQYDATSNIGLVGWVQANKVGIETKDRNSIYNPTVDINVETLLKKEKLEGVTPVIITWPLFSENEVTAVLQWVCIEKRNFTFGDDGQFNSKNSTHVGILYKFIDMMMFFIEKWFPHNHRMLWTRAKHLNLRMKTLVAFSVGEERAANLIQRVYKKWKAVLKIKNN